MIERIIGSTWFLIVAWIVGPTILILLRKQAKAKAAAASASAAYQSEPSVERTRPGVPAAEGSREKTQPGTAADTGSHETTQLPGGFRDLKWGESPQDQMTVIHADADDKLYSRASDELKYGGAPLNSILYSFFRGRLQAVMIDMPIGSADPVFKTISAQWGTPKQPNPRQQKFYWLNRRSGPESTQAVFERSPLAGKASLIISSKQIQDERDKAKAAAKA